MAPAREALEEVYEGGVAIREAERAIQGDGTQTEDAKLMAMHNLRATAVPRVAKMVDGRLGELRRELRAVEVQIERELTPPSTPASLHEAGEIRSYLRNLNDRARHGFVMKAAHAGDRVTMHAVLTARPYLSGITEEQQSIYRIPLVAAVAPELKATADALQEAIEVVQSVGQSFVKRNSPEARPGVQAIRSRSNKAAKAVARATGGR
jgi:hypothetical protein